MFFGPIGKTRWPPGLWLAEIFSTSSLKPLNGIQGNLTGSKISTSSTRLAFLRAYQKNKIAALSSDWLRHFWLLLWNHWTEFNETWQKASSQRPLPSLCFSGLSKKRYGRPGLWLAETYFDFSSETAEWNSAKLDRKQGLNVLCQVCVFRAEKWIKIATLANPSKKVAHCTQVHVMGPFGPLVYEFIKVKLGGGECTNSCICLGTHSQPLSY